MVLILPSFSSPSHPQSTLRLPAPPPPPKTSPSNPSSNPNSHPFPLDLHPLQTKHHTHSPPPIILLQPTIHCHIACLTYRNLNILRTTLWDSSVNWARPFLDVKYRLLATQGQEHDCTCLAGTGHLFLGPGKAFPRPKFFRHGCLPWPNFLLYKFNRPPRRFSSARNSPCLHHCPPSPTD